MNRNTPSGWTGAVASLTLLALLPACDKKAPPSARDDIEKTRPRLIEDMDRFAEPPKPESPPVAPGEEGRPTTPPSPEPTPPAKSP